MGLQQFKKTIHGIIVVLIAVSGQILHAQPACVPTNCCCGGVSQLPLPGGDFEGAPFAPLDNIITFFAGETFHNWTVQSGSVDLVGPNTPNFAFGNPNGPSQHIDLNGLTNGTITTTITGMVPGYSYTIVLWYAKNPGTPVANCNIRVAGGAWLNESWSATNNGGDIWLERCFTFTAQAASAELRLIGSSNVQVSGMLLDDITIWVCPQNNQAPVFLTSPANVTVSCDSDVFANFNTWLSNYGGAVATDNCDQDLEWITNVLVPFNGTCGSFPVSFSVRDDCFNTAVRTALFVVTDPTPPVLLQAAMNMTLICPENGADSISLWLAAHGGAQAVDPCGPVSWSNNFSGNFNQPIIEVTFTATDKCQNSIATTATFTQIITQDTVLLSANTCDPAQAGVSQYSTFQGACETVFITTTNLLPSNEIALDSFSCDPAAVGVFTQNLSN